MTNHWQLSRARVAIVRIPLSLKVILGVLEVLAVRTLYALIRHIRCFTIVAALDLRVHKSDAQQP